MRKPCFIDIDGQPYFEDARHDLRDRRGQLLGLEQEQNIRAILRLLEACKATEPKLPAGAQARLREAITKRQLHA